MGAGLLLRVNLRFLSAAALAACAVTASAAGGASLWSQAADKLLPADQAFALLPVERSGKRLKLSWNIAPGYYLYRERIRVEAVSPGPLKLGTLQLPAGIAHIDEHFGAVQIYRGPLEATLPVRGLGHNPLQLRIQFQGCADAGVCYPPQTVEQTLQP